MDGNQVVVILAIVAVVGLLVRRYHEAAVHRAGRLEQRRREAAHPIPYRPDQRIRAQRQRLSRRLGAKGLKAKVPHVLD